VKPSLTPPAASVWDTKVAPFLERFALPLALCFILIGAARIVSTYREISVTFDEPYHFSCGLEYLATHKACAPEKPPLEPLASAVLPFLDGARPDLTINARVSRRDDIGCALMWSLFRQMSDPWRLIARMRAGVLPFFVIGALAVFFGTRRFLGKTEAVLATALFTLVPSVLAHAGLATTDSAATATVAVAFFTLAWWAERPSWKRSVCLGAALGLAIFAKFSSIPYLGLAAAFGIGFYIATRRPARDELLRMARERVAPLLVAGGVAVFVWWAGCLFSVGRVAGWPAWIRVPAPELFGAFRELMAHMQRGNGAYLLGEFRLTGWWYFYPVVLAIKTPIPLMIAAAAGLFACWQRRMRYGLLPVALCLGVLLVAMTSRINLGVRHVLPFYGGMSIVGALGLVRLARISVFLPAALIVWMALSGARAHPDYLSYFNEFVGDRPEEIIGDSDLEWDSNWVRVGQFLREQGAREVTLDIGFNPFSSEEVLRRVYGFPPAFTTGPGELPRPGWHVVDVLMLRVTMAKGIFHTSDTTPLGLLAAVRGPAFYRLRLIRRFGGLAVLYADPAGQ
jgi:hypothetical protein